MSGGADLPEIERRALDAIDLDRLVDDLGALIAIDSSDGNETQAQEWMADAMADAGLDVDVWELDLPTLRADPACSEELDREHALGVVGRLGPDPAGPGPTLVLNGHVDVVPAGEPRLWSVPPFEATICDGRVYGRGSADMKGGLLCGLHALRAVRTAGLEPPGTVLFQSVVGEEDGGIGTLAAVRRGYAGDGAIVLEPTNGVLAPAQAGAFNFRITVPGRAAHGALRTEGVDPIDRFIPLYRAIQALERRRNDRPRHPLFADLELPYAICVGTVRAGIWASTVAESLTFEGRLGVAPDEDPEEARRELEAVVIDIAESDPWLRDHPPELEWWGGQFEPAATPPSDPLVRAVHTAHRGAAGAALPVRGMPYGADLRLLVNEGRTPGVLYGPGDVRRAHAPDEFIEVAELEAVVRTLVLTVLRFGG